MLDMPSKKKMQSPSQAPEAEMDYEMEMEPVEEEMAKPLSDYSVDELKAALAAKLQESAETEEEVLV